MKQSIKLTKYLKSQDKNKNPLSYNDKIKYAQKAFGKSVIKSKARTIIEVMVELTGKHKNVIVVVGSDRVQEFKKLLDKYNGSSAGYAFNDIKVVSAGQRDPELPACSSALCVRSYMAPHSGWCGRSPGSGCSSAGSAAWKSLCWRVRFSRIFWGAVQH